MSKSRSKNMNSRFLLLVLSLALCTQRCAGWWKHTHLYLILCENTCWKTAYWGSNGVCNEGGSGLGACEWGTDCANCGPSLCDSLSGRCEGEHLPIVSSPTLSPTHSPFYHRTLQPTFSPTITPTLSPTITPPPFWTPTMLVVVPAGAGLCVVTLALCVLYWMPLPLSTVKNDKYVEMQEAAEAPMQDTTFENSVGEEA